ncbi:hypothetical protein [Litorilituus lipolyticus]|uniref:Uncharacterized protein n=1 Tax=Litorilituus lipolyticus TaxID=2491017 RepID=A0A502L0T1_9GAMM|nr:hypothetical protein [Litorilituus lipolyticus]TPH17326.1 hypothetical protein EPA86_04915 [Litorilituus lipolyticus]
MKKMTKVFTSFVLLLFVLYQSYFFILPSITLVNNTSDTINVAVVTLPNSRIDFGEIKSSQRNTIYYELEQSDGEYQYHIAIKDKIFKGKCGYITHSEYHKRIEIVVDINQVSCQFN